MKVPTFLETGHMEEGVPIRVIHTGSAFNYAAHWHEEVELVVVNGKSATIRVNSYLYELEHGDVLIIKPGDVHCFLPDTEQLTIILFRLELLTGSYTAEKEIHDMRELFHKTSVFQSNESSERKLSCYVDAISAEQRSQLPGYQWLMIARLYDLIVHLVRTKAQYSSAYLKEQPQSSFRNFEFIEHICEYLEDHYADPIKLEHVAEHIKFSKFYVCALFKEIKGITLMEYLNHFRIVKSEWALLFSKDSILDIAIGHGFNNTNTYNRLFKKYNHCTPSEFRKKYRTSTTTYEG